MTSGSVTSGFEAVGREAVGIEASVALAAGATDLPTNASEMREWLVSRVAYYLDVPAEQIAVDVPLPTYGLDSVYALSLCADIEDGLGLPIEPTLVWDLDTVEALAEHLAEQLAEQLGGHVSEPSGEQLAGPLREELGSAQPTAGAV